MSLTLPGGRTARADPEHSDAGGGAGRVSTARDGSARAAVRGDPAMMTKGMRKSYMQTMKIWPRAVELHPATRQPLPERDDDWRLTMMDEDEGAYRLQNTLTRHILDLYKDDIIGFRSRGVLMLRGTTTLCGDDVIFEP